MKKRSLLTLVQWGGVIFLLTLLISCPGSSDIKIHTVTLDLGYDGAPPPEKVEIEDGKVLSPITDPVRSGYQFEAWFTADGTPYNFDTPVTESFTLTARWKIKSSGGGGSSASSEEESLKGQWAVYMEEEGVETPLQDIIDIQHTLPDYWIIIFTFEESTLGAPVKSDRKGPDKDGWFEVTDHSDPDSAFKIRYKFADNDRDTLEVELLIDDAPTPVSLILKRIPREEEIIMHIVSFKLDDSIASAGYTFHSELAAVKDGTSFGDKGLPILELNGAEVPALFTLADGTEFTEDTSVTDDIIVTVTPPGVWNEIHYVSNEEELRNWAKAVYDIDSPDTAAFDTACVLIDDIDLADEWSPVCFTESYEGIFDGRGHKIRGLKIEAQGNPKGLFSAISEGAVVKNLTVEASFTNTSSYGNVGVVVGRNKGKIENCHSIINGDVSASNFGGITAENVGSIIGCSSIIKGRVSGSNNVGGIAGSNTADKSTIAASFMILENGYSLSSSTYCGGIVGSNTYGSVTGCYSVINGTISATDSTPCAISVGGNRIACYWQSSEEEFVPGDNDDSNVTEVTTTDGWATAMSAMNTALKDNDYQFEKNEGTDAGMIPLIIVPSST